MVAINYNYIWLAMICITILDAVALLKGINGTMFSLSLAAIAGLAGWVMPQPMKTNGGG